jgi:hypothetical protein
MFQLLISVFISSVRAIDDVNIQPPGLYGKSIVVTTPGRDIQFTAPDKERHDLWMSVSTGYMSRRIYLTIRLYHSCCKRTVPGIPTSTRPQ